MKNQSSENYLDQLLSAIEGGGLTPEMELSEAMENVPMDDYERELFGGKPASGRAKKEEEFRKEFEEELLKEDASRAADNFATEPDIPSFGEADNLGIEPDSLSVSESDDGMDMTDASIEDMISRMDSFGKEDEKANPILDAMTEAAGEMPADALAEAPLGEDGELDLSGMGGNDLLDILAGNDLGDLGDMLSADSSGTELSDVDEFGDFAKEQMQAQPEESKPEEEAAEGGRKKKRRKKAKKKKGKEKDAETGIDVDAQPEGFMKKLGRVFFGEDEPEETVVVSAADGVDVSQLSAENQQILKEMESSEEEGKGKKGKKKKEKKEKPPKEKKEKPPKQKKPKKEKPPKEKDNTPPLPKGPVIAILIMVGSLLGLVVVGTNLLGYQTNVSQAKELYGQGAYAEAFSQLSGTKIREKDERLYAQLATLAPVSAEYNTYLVFADAGKDDGALDALICAYGRYDKNLDSAREYECTGELENLGGKILTSLLEDYDMTGEEALSLYHLRSRKEYTIQLHRKLQELGLE